MKLYALIPALIICLGLGASSAFAHHQHKEGLSHFDHAVEHVVEDANHSHVSGAHAPAPATPDHLPGKASS